MSSLFVQQDTLKPVRVVANEYVDCATKCVFLASFHSNMHILRMNALDSKDIKLLAHLQRDSQASAQVLADDLGMSASQISRRRQRLEAEGYIVGTPSRLDPERLGLSVQAFIQVETRAQSTGTHQSIKRLVSTTPEIVAAWTLTGEADYIFRVYCTNLAALNRLVQDVLLQHDSIGRVHSQIVMDQVKDDTALPLPQ